VQRGFIFPILRDVLSFRQTLINTKIEDRHRLQKIYDDCKLAHQWSCYTIYVGRFYKCSPAPFMAGWLKQHNIQFDNRDHDGVSIHNNPWLRDALQAYLNSRKPLRACSYCLGSSGFDFPHRQLKKKDINAALGRADGPVAALIDDRKLGVQP
jgi:hypothetical protein